MNIQIERVVVFGAGVMGSQIAAHLINAGFQVKLIDVAPLDCKISNENYIPSKVRNQIAQNGLNLLIKGNPPSFYLNENAAHIEIGNTEDNLGWVKNADWIIEAISENFEAKLDLLKKIAAIRRVGTIISSNTSGICLQRLANNLDKDFQKYWLGTHFFNPPRYLKLLEIIPTPKTLDQVVETLNFVGEKRLGKRIVIAKDTPNFIANRIGAFALQQMVRIIETGEYQIDEIDQLTGLLIGRSKSATFRTLDLVGLDTFVQVNKNILENAPKDEQRNIFESPEFVKRLLELKWFGRKSGQGLYRKDVVGQILKLNPKEMTYLPCTNINYKSVKLAKKIPSLKDRLRFLVESKDSAGNLIWNALSGVMLYAANRIPEISDDIVSIDNAIKWGFNWELGPFELWDSLAPEVIVKRLESERKVIPKIVETIIQTPNKSFYLNKLSSSKYFDFNSEKYKLILVPKEFLTLSSVKKPSTIIHQNQSASLIDIGQGVIALEFHSKMNTISRETLDIINKSLMTLQSNFLGMVIANQGTHFSAGADLTYILMEGKRKNWRNLEEMIQLFQKTNMMIKYSPKPIVVAPFGLTLGGGCEISLHASRIQAAAESYMGLVELGVGLIPAAGGTKETILRCLEKSVDQIDLLKQIRSMFKIIAKARVSQSALEARILGFLRSTDQISMNGDAQLADAKRMVLSMIQEGYVRTQSHPNISILGRSALSILKVEMHQMLRGNFISEYDFHLGSKLGYVLCGGNCQSEQTVSEQFLLDLERECFLSLCGEEKTQQRIKFMLEKGKPLKN